MSVGIRVLHGTFARRWLWRGLLIGWFALAVAPAHATVGVAYQMLLVIQDPVLAARYTRNWQDHAQHSEAYAGKSPQP